ncbi:MAG: hypothetical protein PVJ67_05340 [Candidatus Pacearchaeota archaeon]|jgi:hypothetical protein
MKNKKGFLLAEETLKIIIAVIAIGFLIYFLTSLYLRNQQNKDLELAKATLENLIRDSELGEVLIYNLEDLVLVSFSLANGLPNRCSNLGWEKCLCICEEDFHLFGEDLSGDCDELGHCMESDLVVNEKIKIENPPVKILINNGEITK